MHSLELTYSLRRIRSAKQDPELLARVLSIYQASTPQLESAAGNEILYWSDRYNSEFDDELFLFALEINGTTAGFAQCVRFSGAGFTVLDYMSVDKEHKTVGVFLLFYEQIVAFFKLTNRQSDYVVAEILLDGTGEFTDSSEFWRAVMALERFRVINGPYRQLPLGRKKYETDLPANLMICATDEVKSIRRETFLNIVQTLLFDHYVRWYHPFQTEAEALEYRESAGRVFDAIKSGLTMERLGLSPLPGITLPNGSVQASYKANKGLIVFETVTYVLLLALLFTGDFFLKLGATEILLLAVGALLVRLALLSVFVPDARRSLDAALVALNGLLGKKHPIARKPSKDSTDNL